VGCLGVCGACWVWLRFGVGALRMAWRGMPVVVGGDGGLNHSAWQDAGEW
jgi:hypothetical protein